jgi:hypothetical protein
VITKDQASDLRSLQDNVIHRACELELARLALAEAKQKFDMYLWNLEHEKDITKNNDTD